MHEELGAVADAARRGVLILLLGLTGACSAPPEAPETADASADSAVAESAAGVSEARPAPHATTAEPWQRQPAPTDLPTDRPLAVGFLAVDGVYNSELMAPYDILHHTVFHTQPGMTVFVVSPDGQPVTSFEGLEIGAHHSFANAPPIDVLVVPSAEHSMDTDLENEAMMHWVRTTAEKARYVLSLCDGAFVLAAAGLLDGHAVTTFPGDQDAFAERFPALDLRRGVTFVHDRRMITSVGGALSYDPALYLVDHLYGRQVAQGVARGLVLPWPPTGDVMPVTVMPVTVVPAKTKTTDPPEATS